MQCNLQRPTIGYQLTIGKTKQKNIGYQFSLKVGISTTLVCTYPILSQKHLCCKKGEAKKVQATERFKSMNSLWGLGEKIYQQGCVELHIQAG